MKTFKSINKLYQQLFPLVFLILMVTSCSKKEPCDSKGPDVISITLVDNNDNNLINKKYSSDSVRFIMGNEYILITIDNGTITYLYYPWEFILNSNYYLYLSYTDTDTLKLKYYSFKTECGTSYRCNGLVYNSQDISPVSNSNIAFKIIKK